MRAACEHCEQLQPLDWKPGELCIHCGHAVRHEVRCAWCAKWTPASKYCRSCGAEVVAEEHYGAARMLKDAGVDRFTIPRQLATLDPEQVENFTRIYQGHAIVVARHVEQLTFLQRWLRHQHWAAAVEEQLVPELPWPEDGLERYSTEPIPLIADDRVTAARTAATIEQTSPFPTSRALAAIARLRLDDWDAFAAVSDAFHSGDSELRDDAALALSGWRVLHALGPSDARYELIDALRSSTFTIEAGVRLATLAPDQFTLPDGARTSPDAETRVGAALVAGDVDRLEAALAGDELERAAAGAALARLGETQRLADLLRDGLDEVRLPVLQALSYARRPVPDLTDVLVEVFESTSHAKVRDLATRVAGPTLQIGEALRIARAAEGDRGVLQSLLQRTELTPEGIAELLDFMIERGLFTMSQYGLSTVAENGVLPDGFVPSRFADASTETRIELLGLAELQLHQRGDEGLHRFLMGVVFGPENGQLRTTAWWVLHRWYQGQGDYRGEGPFRLDPASVTRFFDSLDEFLPRLTDVVGDLDGLDEVAFTDFASNLFRSADPALVADIQARHHAGGRLVAALADTITAGVRDGVQESMIVFLSQLATLPAWRSDALTTLRAVGRAGNYHYDKAVRRLELAEFGIPTDDEWPSLPADFVPSRFAEVSTAGQLELLNVAEQQLIHCTGEPDRALLRFLAGIAGREPDSDIGRRAHLIHQERAPRDVPSFERPDT